MNTKLFHLVANGRRTKNFIAAIKHGDKTITDQGRKEEVFFQTYRDLIGSVETREETINPDMIAFPMHDLQALGDIFTKAEVWEVIRELPSDHAPGPDGFGGAFYKCAWATIKLEIMVALLKLYIGDGCSFGHLNTALMMLILKKQQAEGVGDYRPIYLVHTFAKLFSKLIANWLRSRMDQLVSAN
jgi:hypothetical protein